MATYRASFQCPATGQDVEARYAFGRVTVKPSYGSVHYKVDEHMLGRDESERAEMERKIAGWTKETEQWCADVSGRRFRSYEEANDYVMDISDGDTFGLEEE